MTIAGAVLGATLIATPATAAPPICAERDDFLTQLAQKYGETPVGIGVTTTGGLVEVLSDVKDGTWTIIVTTPQGMSCLVAAGEGWRTKEQLSMEPEA